MVTGEKNLVAYSMGTRKYRAIDNLQSGSNPGTSTEKGKRDGDMKTYKIELTKQQNNLIALRCKDETLALSAKFGGMNKTYTFWLTEREKFIIADVIEEQPKVLQEFD